MSAGASDSLVFYQSGQIVGSGLATSFAGSGQTAIISYAVLPNRDISPIALVSQNGVTSYVLNVDPSGRIVVTVATKTYTSSGSTPVQPGTMQQGRTHISTPDDGISPGLCAELFDTFCDHIALGGIACYFFGLEVCAANLELTPAGQAACAILAGIACGFASTALCKAAEGAICPANCPVNQQLCNEICCDPCMDCLNGECVPNVTCGNQVCCNNVCCADGFTCTNGVCTSPSGGCVGATCDTFIPCSGSNQDCVCATLAEGGGLCVPGSTPCDSLVPCDNGACPDGSVCAIGSCCGEPVCVPLSLQCPADMLRSTHKSRHSSPLPRRGGRTIAHR